MALTLLDLSAALTMTFYYIECVGRMVSMESHSTGSSRISPGGGEGDNTSGMMDAAQRLHLSTLAFYKGRPSARSYSSCTLLI